MGVLVKKWTVHEGSRVHMHGDAAHTVTAGVIGYCVLADGLDP